MPNRKDEFRQGHYYHIFNRGADRRDIFANEENYRYLLRLIHKYSKEKATAIVSYCLMPNHYHLLVCQKSSTPVSEFIECIFKAYAQAFNKQQGRKGFLFEGRFKHVPVTKQSYFVHLMRYIHLNPVAARMVTRPEDWRFSDYKLWASMAVDESLSINNAERLVTFRNELGLPDPGDYRKLVMEYQLEQEEQKELQQYLID
jgi:putative transposase